MPIPPARVLEELRPGAGSAERLVDEVDFAEPFARPERIRNADRPAGLRAPPGALPRASTLLRPPWSK